MLVKLHSTEITAQRLTIHLHTLTTVDLVVHCASCRFYLLCGSSCCVNRNCVGISPLAANEIDWKEGNKGAAGEKHRVMEYKVATLLLFSKGQFVM